MENVENLADLNKFMSAALKEDHEQKLTAGEWVPIVRNDELWLVHKTEGEKFIKKVPPRKRIDFTKKREEKR